MEEQSLYQNVRKKICRMIYEDIYHDGESIPPERKLAEDLGVSRVTVRKALKLLEEEHIIERVQGSGTRIALEYGARTGNMDIITLVAPAQNAFFSRFLDAFQTEAEELDSLVLYKQKPRQQSLEQCLFHIYEKDLRNVVLWLEDMELDPEALRKLRGLGMNIVLFDTALKSSYADSVCIDNRDAVRRLVGCLQEEGCENIGFVGWDDEQVSTVRIREEEFRKLCPEGGVLRIPREYHNCLDYMDPETAEEYLEKLRDCDGILYQVGELAIPLERAARRKNINHRVAMIGENYESRRKPAIMIEQDFQGMAERIFGCLKKQNRKGSAWKPGLYSEKGILKKGEDTEYACNGN